MWLQEKTRKNLHHQQYHQNHHLMAVVIKILFMQIKLVGHNPTPPPPVILHKGGMKFFKNCCNRRDGKYLLEIGGSQEWGGWFFNGVDGKLLKSLYIVGRGVLTSLFYEDLPYIAYPLFTNVVHPPSHFPVTSKPHHHCSFCCHISLTKWVIMPHLMCYFT